MAIGDRINVADKATLDRIDANVRGIYATVQDIDGYFGSVKRYGVKIDKNNSDPATRIEYLYDAVGMRPAHMDYTNGVFDYGDWGDVWFVKDNYPCMLGYDGIEKYKLNQNDYSQKEDGTPSDVADEAFEGNAMSAIPLVWKSQYETKTHEYIILCNVKYDDTYHAYAHTREDGSIMSKIYLSIYKGYYDGTRLRSLSGRVITYNANAQQEIDRAAVNNTGGSKLWGTRTWAQRDLINALLTVIGKDDNTQRAFGQGNTTGYVNSVEQNYGELPTGTLDAMGQFFGYNTTKSEVKVFHIEGWWGNIYERILGCIADNGRIKVKLTPPYNLTGAGYIDTGISIIATEEGYSRGYCNKTKMAHYGRIPRDTSGSATTFLCDYFYAYQFGIRVALAGGGCVDGTSCGAFYVDLHVSASYAGWYFGAALSCEQPSAA